MFEIKIVKILNRLYQLGIKFAIQSVERRDTATLKRLDTAIVMADRARDAAKRMRAEAERIETQANYDYLKDNVAITEAHNMLSNLRDDHKLED